MESVLQKPSRNCTKRPMTGSQPPLSVLQNPPATGRMSRAARKGGGLLCELENVKVSLQVLSSVACCDYTTQEAGRWKKALPCANPRFIQCHGMCIGHHIPLALHGQVTGKREASSPCRCPMPGAALAQGVGLDSRTRKRRRNPVLIRHLVLACPQVSKCFGRHSPACLGKALANRRGSPKIYIN